METKASLERELKNHFQNEKIEFMDNSGSYKKLDFTILKNKQPKFYLEVKEKRNPYVPTNWPNFAPEADLLILDELTARKCLAYAPISGLLVRDNRRSSYFFFSIVDLALMPKKRVNRKIQRKKTAIKGKWLINLNNGRVSSSLGGAVEHIRDYLNKREAILHEQLFCYGDYAGEEIESGGITRTPSHWEEDVRSTR